MSTSAILALADGSVFHGTSIGIDSGHTTGEVVFNTALTGYQEILTDPSYARQLVTLTYPHIGNVGINPEDLESDGIKAAGLIIRDLPPVVSNWRASTTLTDYLVEHNIVAIADIDTRRLTRLLRDKGAQSGCIMVGDDVSEADAIAAAQACPSMQGLDLAQEYGTTVSYQWNETIWDLQSGYGERSDSQFNIVAYDYGVKRNILRLLAARGCQITVVPPKTPAADVLAMNPDGVFLSNGPGDPEPCDYAIENIQTILAAKIPTFGICLGHQLLGLASGAKTLKMKFGHHGANHPVQDLVTQQVLITSQNHGFAIDENNIPEHIEVTHRSLFDGTVQGIRRTDVPAFSFQGHPEASPGPHDLRPLFDQFIQLMND